MFQIFGSNQNEANMICDFIRKDNKEEVIKIWKNIGINEKYHDILYMRFRREFKKFFKVEDISYLLSDISKLEKITSVVMYSDGGGVRSTYMKNGKIKDCYANVIENDEIKQLWKITEIN